MPTGEGSAGSPLTTPQYDRHMLEVSVVIPTLGRPRRLTRALDRLARQQRVDPGKFEMLVVTDARGSNRGAAAPVGDRPYRVRALAATIAGASAARNLGWRNARAPIVLFLGDDILARPNLLAEHLSWHRHHPEPEVGVLGSVEWADELRVTPFMRWLESGIQFDYNTIVGCEAKWWHLYTANVSLKRAMLERVGGFDEGFPFLYEDLDLGKRLDEEGFRLLYNRRAVGEHLHETTVADWQARVALVARAERRFVSKHPAVQPHFFKLFERASRRPPARGRGARLASVVPRGTPLVGPRVWASAEAVYLKALAPHFLAAWHANDDGEERKGAVPEERRASSAGGRETSDAAGDAYL